jgi:hypothetical protein
VHSEDVLFAKIFDILASEYEVENLEESARKRITTAQATLLRDTCFLWLSSLFYSAMTMG